jgi:hypothetical protein
MQIKKMLKTLDRNNLTNTQRVLVTLLSQPGQWVARSSIRVPNASSRLRDLRKTEHGGFTIECATPAELNRRQTPGTTFYRLDPASISERRIRKALKGVIATS